MEPLHPSILGGNDQAAGSPDGATIHHGRGQAGPGGEPQDLLGLGLGQPVRSRLTAKHIGPK